MTFSLLEVLLAEEKVMSNDLFRLGHRGLRSFQGDLSVVYTDSVCRQCSILFVHQSRHLLVCDSNMLLLFVIHNEGLWIKRDKIVVILFFSDLFKLFTLTV